MVVKEIPMASDSYHVVVTHPHGDYQRGDVETDQKKVDALLRDHPTKVAKIIPAQ
jgi:hypothetical protein